MKATAAKGRTSKHAGSHKHAGSGKHHPTKQPAGAKAHKQSTTVKTKHPSHAKARGLALGAEWPCCPSEALGASLRLAGWPVADEDVLALHVAAGGSVDRAVPILAALDAAAEHGLAGVRPLNFSPVDLRGLYVFRSPMILGLELPGAHAVTVASDGCWLSWGEHCDPADFPDAVVEEAWVVAWP